MREVDLLTVIFASIIYFVMYLTWYSKFLFASVYKKIMKSNLKFSCFHVLIFIFILVISYVIALFEILMKVTTFWDGVFLGFLIWIGFVLSHSGFLIVSYNRNLKLSILDNILYLLGLMVVGGILAG